MHPSQEPAQPQQSSPPPVDPTADPPPRGTGSGDAGGFGGAAGPSTTPGFGYAADDAGGSYGLAHPSGPDQYRPDQYGPDHYGPDHFGPGHYGTDHYGADPAGYASDGSGLGTIPRSRRPWRRTLVVAVLSGVVVLVLGGPLGLLWAWLAPSVPVIDAGQSGIVVNDPSPEEYIAADGWFALLGLGFGLLVAIVAWLVLRRDRGPFLLLGVVAGTLGAGYLVAPRVGEMIGRSAYRHWQETAVQGATYLAPPEIHSLGPMLVPAFAAAIVLTLLAGWSNDPDLERPGSRPGYGPNAGAGGTEVVQVNRQGAWPGPVEPEQRGV